MLTKKLKFIYLLAIFILFKYDINDNVSQHLSGQLLPRKKKHCLNLKSNSASHFGFENIFLYRSKSFEITNFMSMSGIFLIYL